MKDLKTIKMDLKEIQRSFNPEKSTYKVFDELIKHDYTSEEMINVLSKIRGIHKYPEYLKTRFLDVINNLNALKEQELREKELREKEEEKIRQQAETKELKDIIDNLENAENKNENKDNNLKKDANVVDSANNEGVVQNSNNDKSLEFVKAIDDKIIKENDNSIDENIMNDNYVAEDDGRLLYIILILLVVISLVALGLVILIY